MLSRIAESLFWIGRYVERADDTARIVQVHLRLRAEDPWIGEHDSSRNLIALMGLELPDEGVLDHPEVLRRLGWDRSEPASIVSCWSSARENARRAREVIPSELWETVNTSWRQLPAGRVGVVRAHTFLDWCRERSALFNGVAGQLMVRDDGWQFLRLGRSLEQADMTSRMVASAALAQAHTPWPAVLRGCGAHDAFLRTYRGFRADREAAEFLILDERFPRSVMHGLNTAITCLESLSEVRPRALEQRGDVALRTLGRLRARLAYASFDDLLAGLHEEMGGVQRACDEVARSISQTFFAPSEDTAWTTERTL